MERAPPENIKGVIQNRQSKETGNMVYTRRRLTKQKQNKICVGHHYAQTHTNNVHKTWVLLQTTGHSKSYSQYGVLHARSVRVHYRHNSFVLLAFVLCTPCCQFLWIVYFVLPLWYSLTSIYSHLRNSIFINISALQNSN
jgi:hypothetical protein